MHVGEQIFIPLTTKCASITYPIHITVPLSCAYFPLISIIQDFIRILYNDRKKRRIQLLVCSYLWKYLKGNLTFLRFLSFESVYAFFYLFLSEQSAWYLFFSFPRPHLYTQKYLYKCPAISRCEKCSNDMERNFHDFSSFYLVQVARNCKRNRHHYTFCWVRNMKKKQNSKQN